jgi:hypothetical protein
VVLVVKEEQTSSKRTIFSTATGRRSLAIHLSKSQIGERQLERQGERSLKRSRGISKKRQSEASLKPPSYVSTRNSMILPSVPLQKLELKSSLQS